MTPYVDSEQARRLNAYMSSLEKKHKLEDGLLPRALDGSFVVIAGAGLMVRSKNQELKNAENYDERNVLTDEVRTKIATIIGQI